MLDWIFEGIVKWVAGVASELMDTVSGLFLNALGTDMTAMEEYFPFVTKAFTVMQYCSWAILFLITVWQLFRVFGGPITEAENPLTLIARGSLFAVLIAYAKPIFLITLDMARAPYTALLAHTYPADCPGLELLQAPAGNRGALCGGRCALLHLAAGVLHGGVQGHHTGVQKLVQDGGFSAPAAHHERLVPARV